MRFVDCSSGEGAYALTAALGHAGGRLPVFLDDGPQTLSLPLRGLSEAARGLWRRAEGKDRDFAVGVPVDELGLRPFSTVLWATGKAKAIREHWLDRGRAMPSIVLRVGPQTSERLLIWILDEPLAYLRVENANRAISYALHGPYGQCAPEKLRVPVPGTFLRAGRARPVPVLATRLTLDQVSLGKVCGQLRAPPDPNAWREKR